MDKEDLAFIHTRVLFSNEEKEPLPFVIMWMNPGGIKLRGISQTARWKKVSSTLIRGM